MQVSTKELFQAAEAGQYAIGGFNVYNLEGALAVIAAAEATKSPALLQILPGSLQQAGTPLVLLCQAAVREANVPMNFQLDHSASAEAIQWGLEIGVTSVMADGSHFDYAENLAFTREMVEKAREHGAAVEAELGLLSGTEDGYTVETYQASLTDPDQAVEFVDKTGVDALAVCVGNVHGAYPGEPQLDFERLATIHDKVSVPLVMHGASGLPEAMVTRAIELGIRKFNINTEIRTAYMGALKQHLTATEQTPKNALAMMNDAIAAMQAVIEAKMALFGSVGRA
jgi:tagatose 1,6-diphosphate aldolase GatY/KbaY